MKRKEPLKLNLQLFAEDNAGDGTGGAAASNQDAKPEDNSGAAGEEADTSKEAPGTNAKPTLEELMKDKDFSSAYQKSVDEQVQKALEKKAEEEKLAAMSPEEKEQKRAADLDAREKAVEKELRVSAAEKLTEAEAPKELANLVDYSSAEAMEKSIATVIETFNKAVQAGVDGRLAGGGVMKKAPEERNTVDEDAIMKAVNGEY